MTSDELHGLTELHIDIRICTHIPGGKASNDGTPTFELFTRSRPEVGTFSQGAPRLNWRIEAG